MDQLFAAVAPSVPAPAWLPDDLHDAPAHKQIRRRSSKACDQCRKSKCKCERPGPHDDACKNCVLLGSPCTFLGPSRKRGPPKGYIDAIESRLHQLEALFGVLLAADDPRARSLLDDLSGDPLARDIIQRVDSSPFGSRPTQPPADVLDDRASRILRASPRPGRAVPFASPSTEWQLHLKERLCAGALRVRRASEGAAGESPRQRRRLHSASPQLYLHSFPSAAATATTTSSPSPEPSSSSDDEDLASAVGQLSLNEESQLRYHSKLSGLHILGQSARLDKRNEGGIWRFPKAGVWPRAPHSADRARRDLQSAELDARAHFPPLAVQCELLDLYFAYVHPVLPLMQEAQFWRDFRGEPVHSAPTECKPRVPTLLLLSMFAIAARYRPTPDVPLPTSEGDMWGAGDEHLEHAKRILNQTFASSRPSTCQALLLLSYREVGIGAMAQAWLYVGMAVRMAQDLGMHRSAEKWQRTGAELFTETERQLRNRIWYACVVMDKYVSAYIGRPLSIFERDFDTPYPSEDPAEENALWQRRCTAWSGHSAAAILGAAPYTPGPTHLMSCFTASARLASILSQIVETIYAVQLPPTHARHADAAALEARLDRWYVGLAPHLQLAGAGASAAVPPPHVFTLHMQYWCAVLLLHRPFMRRKLHVSVHGGQTAHEAEAEAAASCHKAFDLCAMAATKISNTVSRYKDTFCLQCSPAFLTYYVFSASIMHMTTLSVRPADVQAAMGLQRCMDALHKMHIVWPSAGRAWELLHGAKIDAHDLAPPPPPPEHEKRKRDEAEEAAAAHDPAPHPHPHPHPHPQFAWPDALSDLADLPGDLLLEGVGEFLPKMDVWKDFAAAAAAPAGAFGGGAADALYGGGGGGAQFVGNGFPLYSTGMHAGGRDPVSSDGAF